MSDPRDGLDKFLWNLFDVLNQVIEMMMVPDLTAVLKEWSDIDAESFDEKILVEVNDLRISRDRTAALCVMLSIVFKWLIK